MEELATVWDTLLQRAKRSFRDHVGLYPDGDLETDAKIHDRMRDLEDHLVSQFRGELRELLSRERYRLYRDAALKKP